MADEINKKFDEEDVLGEEAVEGATEEVSETAELETALVAASETKPASASETKPAKKSKEAKKPNIFVRIGRSLKKFWKSMKSELKRVTWISRKQTFTSTLLVLVCMAISMVVIGLLDVGLSVGLEAIANLF